MTPEKETKILQEARDRLKKAIEEDTENRRMALEDLRFVAEDGAQWPEGVKAERESVGRPCLTTNKMPAYIDQVVGDQRMNRPSIKVIPVDSKGDVEVARILGGWIKHVQQISKSDIAVDHGFEHTVACGYGAIRVVTEYTSDSSFEQEAYIRQVDNALAVYWGKHSEYDCSDAKYCFIISDMDREEFKDKYGEDPMPFNYADSQYMDGWATNDTVRLAEYFVKEPVRKIIYELVDGRVVDKVEDGDVVNKKRDVDGYKVMWYLLTGNKVLDSREWVGKKYIPVVPIFGKEFNVGGKRIVRGLIRNAKDSQRMYNYWNSVETEVVALQPKSPYILTPKQIAGFEEQWMRSNKENFPYLLANPDKDAPGWPQRQTPPQASSAMIERIQAADQEIRDTIGIQKAGMGMTSNERSGAAIRERKREGDVGTFAFIDNLARSIEHLGRVLVDIAPALLDTDRIIRLGLESGEQEFVEVNQATPEGSIINDLSVGVYDVVVTVGPSFTTQRTEAQNSMKEFIQYFPQAAPLIGDLYAKSMDWPGAADFADRLMFLLPPEIKAKQEAEKAKKEMGGQQVLNGVPPPTPPFPAAPPTEQGSPPPPPEPPDPTIPLKLQELEIKLEQERAKLEGIRLQNQEAQMKTKEGIKKLLIEVLEESSRQEGGV